MAKVAAKAKPEIKSSIEVFDCDQGSEDWIACRLGIITASNFNKVLAEGDGKVRSRYMRDLAGELITGLPAESYKNAAMERGNTVEPEAAEQYSRRNFNEMTRVGFMKNSGLIRGVTIGASPDYLIGSEGGLEIKSMIPALMIERFERGAGMPSEHRAQVQGCMWVCDRHWWDVKLYYPGMPDYTVRVLRDPVYIADTLSPGVERFAYELRKLVEKIKSMGAR